MTPFEKTLNLPLRAGSRAFAGSLEYTSKDPYTVRLVITRRNQRVPWTFERTMLRDGRTRAVGIGDVQIRPGRNEHYMLIRVQSPGGDITFEAATALITVFVDRIFEAVPEGRELEWLDLDSKIAQLLKEEDEPA